MNQVLIKSKGNGLRRLRPEWLVLAVLISVAAAAVA